MKMADKKPDPQDQQILRDAGERMIGQSGDLMFDKRGPNVQLQQDRGPANAVRGDTARR
jgi:hypothetical protein